MACFGKSINFMLQLCINVCRFQLGLYCGGDINKQGDQDCYDGCVAMSVREKLKNDSGKLVALQLGESGGCKKYVLKPKPSLPKKHSFQK